MPIELIKLFGGLGLVILFWVVPIKYGIRIAKSRGFSPHWMWLGIHPFFGWMAFGIMASLKRCPACNKIVGVRNKFCPICANSFAEGDIGTSISTTISRAEYALQMAAGSSGGFANPSMDLKVNKIKKILRAVEKRNNRQSLETAKAMDSLPAHGIASDAQPMDEEALAREVSQILTELESTPVGKAVQSRENWWALTSDIYQCPNCRSIVNVHEPYCGTCGAATPRIICPCCGGHNTQVKTQRLGYTLVGIGFATLVGLCFALADAYKYDSTIFNIIVAWICVFGVATAVCVWFAVSTRSKRLVCASCRRVSAIDPNKARWWTPESAGLASPEQDQSETIEATAVEVLPLVGGSRF
jgi:hypothetical protein